MEAPFFKRNGGSLNLFFVVSKVVKKPVIVLCKLLNTRFHKLKQDRFNEKKRKYQKKTNRMMDSTLLSSVFRMIKTEPMPHFLFEKIRSTCVSIDLEATFV